MLRKNGVGVNYSVTNLRQSCLCSSRKFYLTCVENDDDEEDDEEGDEVLAEDGEVAEQEEKPEDLLDNYYLFPGEDMEVCSL